MDYRVRRITKLVREYDPALKAKRDSNGTIHIFRSRPRMSHFEFNGQPYAHVQIVDDCILSLTDNWTVSGRGVERGLDPLMRKLTELDGWRDDTGYDKFAERRERQRLDQERMHRNNMKAAALDARRDFAKATNDITVRQDNLYQKQGF